ncbi:MAG: hypothetical protein ACAI44_29625 [Candidatus Sericytochromatia bacterium]
MLMVLSLQNLVHIQSALASSPVAAQPETGLSDQERTGPQEAASPVPEPIRFGPADTSLAMSGDDGLMCCIGEILLLVGVLAIVVLLTNGILWLLKRPEKR